MPQGTTVVGPLVSVVLVLAGSVLGRCWGWWHAIHVPFLKGNPTNGSSSMLGTHLGVLVRDSALGLGGAA